jgi:hypothetical protein
LVIRYRFLLSSIRHQHGIRVVNVIPNQVLNQVQDLTISGSQVWV